MEEMAWFVPILIYFARICDVSIGTVRMIMVIGGHPWLSALLGFFEVLIWVMAVGGVILYLDNVFALLGYAGGFSTGVIVGMFIEERIALGHRLVRAINADVGTDLSGHLREHGFFVTRVEGSGRSGPVEVAFTIVRRRELDRLQSAIAEAAPKAFISIGQADRPTAAALGSDSRFGRRSWLRALSPRK